MLLSDNYARPLTFAYFTFSDYITVECNGLELDIELPIIM